ncbi:MAG: hypothetical protein ACT4R6_05105 [Gemmatimonadaceae bacterium]
MKSIQTDHDVATARPLTPDERYRALASYFHRLRNAHNRVVLGIDVLLNKPVGDEERQRRLEKLRDAAREVTDVLNDAPLPDRP